MKPETKSKLLNILRLMLVTFLEGAGAYLILNCEQIVSLIPEGWAVMQPVLTSVVIGAVAAGLSAIYNGLLKPMLDKNKSTDTEVT